MRALKVLLETFNIKIDPNEVERAWVQSKDALPRLAQAAEEMNQRQARVEKKLDEILARQILTTNDPSAQIGRDQERAMKQAEEIHV
jgi:hypothetical protein